MRIKLALCLMLPLLTTLVSGQSPITAIQDAHGGAAFLKKLSAYQVQGTLQRPDGSSLAFSLWVEGENSRFETNEGVSLYNGDLQQWWKKGGPRSQAKIARHGTQEIYLSPLYLAAHLDKYQFKATAKADRFTRKPKYRRFVNYEPDTPVIDLDFDLVTHRLASVAFYTEETASAPVTLTFEEYRPYGALWLPSKVTRRFGDRVLSTLEITGVELAAVISSEERVFRDRHLCRGR